MAGGWGHLDVVPERGCVRSTSRSTSGKSNALRLVRWTQPRSYCRSRRRLTF
jgi:hypothetical protein